MSGMYFNPLKRVFLNLSGGTVTGETVFTQGLYTNSLSGDTIYSGGTDLSIILSQIAYSAVTVAPYLPISGGTGGPYYFTGATTGQTIYVENNLEPTADNNSDLGSTIKRFRRLNIINGVAVNFTADTRITTSELKLGSTIVTENNIILTGQTLEGGTW